MEGRGVNGEDMSQKGKTDIFLIALRLPTHLMVQAMLADSCTAEKVRRET
jgi:hypothetical protein